MTGKMKLLILPLQLVFFTAAGTVNASSQRAICGASGTESLLSYADCSENVLDGSSPKSKQSQALRTYLDIDQRPSAIPVTPSAGVALIEANMTFRFKGQLGAIRSEKDPERFVGFAGLEVQSALVPIYVCTTCPLSPHFLSFSTTDEEVFSPQTRVVTVQLVVDKNGVEAIYSRDINIKEGRNYADLRLDSFKKSFRGVEQNETYETKNPILAYRFFLKRSANEPFSTVAMPINFKLSFY